MPKYRLSIVSPVPFDLETPMEVLDLWRGCIRSCPEDSKDSLRLMAILASDITGKPMRFHTEDVLAWDMMEHGLLEKIDEAH